MLEQVAAQAEHDVLADARQAPHQRRGEDPRRGVDRDVQHDRLRQAGVVVLEHPLVDRVLDDEERSDRRGGASDADHGEQSDAGPVSAYVASEAREPDAALSRSTHAASTSSPKRLPKWPPVSSSSSGFPCSTIRPSSTTTARSAIRTVLRRCVATSTVRPASAGRTFAISARASATRCRWPPERLTPRSPISVS